MGVDTSIYSNIQQPNTLANLGNMVGIANALQQNNILQQNQQLNQQSIQSNALNLQKQTQLQTEFSRATEYLKNNTSKYIDPDGTIKPEAVNDDIMRIAPNVGAEMMRNLSANATAQTGYRQAKANLSADQKMALAGVANAVYTNSTDTDDPAEIKKQLDDGLGRFSAAYKDDPNAALLANTAEQLYGNIKDPATFRKALLKFRDENAGATTARQLNTPNALDAGQKIINTAPGVAGFPVGGQVAEKTIPPQIVTPPGGVPQPYTGNGPVPTSYGPGPTPTSGDVENFNQYQMGLNSRVRAASNFIPQINQLDKALSSFKDLGGGTRVRADIAKQLQGLGTPQSLVDAVSRGSLGEVQAAEKYLFQSTLDTLQAGGAGMSDNRFAAASAALPSIDTDPRAKASLMGFIRDRGQRDYAEQQALNTARKNGSFNPATWEADYQNSLRQGKVPNVPESQKPVSEPEQTGTSKSGKPMVFRNGRWEYK